MLGISRDTEPTGRKNTEKEREERERERDSNYGG